jgi:flagellar assembly protein FliH
MGKIDRIYKHNAPDSARWVQPFERLLLEAQQGEVDPSEIDFAAGELDPDALRQQVISEALTEARGEAERKVREAYEEGLRLGMEEGLRRFEERIAHCSEALEEAAEAMKHARQNFLDSLEPEVFDMVRLITERVLAREIRTDKELVLHTARRALECLTHEEKLRIRVNPADYAAMKENQITLLEEFHGVSHIDIDEDEEVSPGGCMIDTTRIHVDARLETLLGHVLGELAD